MIITEQRTTGQYVATITGDTIRIFGPGINGVAEYLANGEADQLAQALDYTVRKIVHRPFYIMKNRGGIFNDPTHHEYLIFDQFGNDLDRIICNSDQAITYARQMKLMPISPAQWSTLVNEWQRGVLTTIANKKWEKP